NLPVIQSHKNDFEENDSDDSVELDINLEALQESASKVFHMQCISVPVELDINLEALQESASKVFHMQCISVQKLSEEYIGRVAFPEYPRWKTESEVAVMEYVRLNTNIPVPKIYYWTSSIDNPVGAEYILMECLPGRRLCNVCSDFVVEKKKIILSKVIDIQLALKKLTIFDNLGEEKSEFYSAVFNQDQVWNVEDFLESLEQ
ncbi:2017_t:CDS:2, partial [Racocetra fulgida]